MKMPSYEFWDDMMFFLIVAMFISILTTIILLMVFTVCILLMNVYFLSLSLLLCLEVFLLVYIGHKYDRYVYRELNRRCNDPEK